MKKFWAFAILLLAGGCISSLPGASDSPLSSPGSARAALSLPEGSENAGLSEDQEPADPETLEDNQVLSGADQAPPEDEGVTVPAKEVTFDFPVVENEKVSYFINYFSGPAKKTFSRWLERSGRYLPMMRDVFTEEGLPQDLAYLSMIESGFNDRAYSWANAAGLWQFIESTGNLYGLENDWWRDERRDPVKATRAAAKHLADLHRMFGGDWYLAVAAYNAGPGKIQRAVSQYDSRDFWKISRGNYLQGETKKYLPKLLAALMIAKEPEKYGFTDLDYQDPMDYEVVEVPTATDLEVVAESCGASYEEIKELNPELKRWCTPPGVKNYEVRIPAGDKDEFVRKYALVPESKRANYQRHRVAKGDTLLALANRFHIRASDIISLNNITNPRALRVGTDLILPLHKGFSRQPLAELGDDYQHSRRATYRVRSGDSLWKIAQRFNVTENQLRVWNRLGWSNLLHPGQNLIVSTHAAKRTNVARKTTGRENRVAYQVRHGDTLWEIARRFNVTEEQLQAWNHLGGRSTIHPGQTLALSAHSAPQKILAQQQNRQVHKIVYQVRPGDTLWGIGRRFDVATHQIMAWNNLSENDVLQPGDDITLMVPAGSPG
jgi:membrane-bound lytic murein transglycosylase D